VFVEQCRHFIYSATRHIIYVDRSSTCVATMSASYAVGPVKKTETVSYRIRSDLKSALADEARRLGINPNALVSQIFDRHISWGRYVEQLKFIPVSKDFLRLIFDSIPQKESEKIGRLLGESAAREEILFLFSRINPDTILSFMDIWASHFDAWDHQYERGKHIFTVKHDVNLNYSHFTKEYVSAMLRGTLETSVRFETMSPNSLTFVFENLSSKPGDNRSLNNTSDNSRGSDWMSNNRKGIRSNNRPEEAIVKN
jgi:hypothetical protein